jgi:thymidylate kinase
MRDTKLIFVEGIVGSGKSTTAKFITDCLTQQQIPARLLPEGGRGHPLRVANSLPHPFQVWRDVTVNQFIRSSVDKWHAFVRTAQRSEAVTVCDGQLLHGNMMDLLLLNAAPNVLQNYVTQVTALLTDLRPVLIYFYQADVAKALHRIGKARGAAWIAYQVQWKLPSPYGCQQELAQLSATQGQPRQHPMDHIPLHVAGFAGLIQLYRVYRALSDTIVPTLPMPTLKIDNTEGSWAAYYHEMLTFLDVPCGTD